jgi:hypothetical protein
MTTKQIAVLIILIVSILCPIIMICIILQAAFGSRGWEGSILKKLLKELD